jgi:glutaryl-CoA dehydrogenase
MAAMDKLGAFALTEPEHGSDSVALETSARRDGDHWVLNGRKRWIGLGSVADLVVVWARNTEDGQVNGFVVEKGTPGYQAQVIEGKVSLRSVWQAEITLDEVRVPAENRLPGARSFKDTTQVLATTRSTCAWAALGHATAAYDVALRYALERHGGYGGHPHLRGHRDDADAHRRPRHHRPRSLHLTIPSPARLGADRLGLMPVSGVGPNPSWTVR